MKIVTVVGARPQFIKLAPVSREIRRDNHEIIVHTGQHYDSNMSGIFFSELNIPTPDYNLNVGSGPHGKQTGEMLQKIEDILLKENPDTVIVYGDTNSTLAGALAASKLLIPVYHIEAGLRSYNMKMPEEQNRVLTDHLSSKLFCPTESAALNLKKENITKNVYVTGDVMYDALLFNINIAKEKSVILKKLYIEDQRYVLATIHRAENTNSKERLTSIINAFNSYGGNIVLPLHPRTREYIKKYDLTFNDNINVIEPVGYTDMLCLENSASMIVTDSGGVQKEAYFLKKPCITLRDETEWSETVNDGWNVLTGADSENIENALTNFKPEKKQSFCFGNGDASKKIASLID